MLVELRQYGSLSKDSFFCFLRKNEINRFRKTKVTVKSLGLDIRALKVFGYAPTDRLTILNKHSRRKKRLLGTGQKMI